MAKPAPKLPPAESLALYEKLVATCPGAERKGATMPYTSRNGHMFSFVTPAGTLALRLPEKDREAFLAKYGTRLCEQHGTVVLKEYVEVPAALFAKTRELARHFATSYEFVGSLRPKATTRTRKPKR